MNPSIQKRLRDIKRICRAVNYTQQGAILEFQNIGSRWRFSLKKFPLRPLRP